MEATRCFLGVGSNLGDRCSFLQKAIALLTEKCCILKVSSIYQTSSLLSDGQKDYYNIVCHASTNLDPYFLLKFIQNVEDSLGRNRNVRRWGERVIDVDIIHMDGMVINDDRLIVPHKSMTERSFVLYPLKEIEPNYIHPNTGLHIDPMIKNLKTDYNIKIVGDIKKGIYA